MYKIEDLKEQKIVIHCNKEWKANVLLEFFHENGITWLSGDSLLSFNLWECNGDVTSYSLFHEKLTYHRTTSINSELWQIIKFEDVISGSYKEM